MPLYLDQSIIPSTIAGAAAAGIFGVKSYPGVGVTMDSGTDLVSYEMFYPVFAAMEHRNMILNLHGEVPSCSASKGTDGVDTTVINADEGFFPKLKDLHARFPK